MRKQLNTLIHSMVVESEVPAKNIAKAVGKAYPTLLREVNPYDKGAKLSAETLLGIMRITKNIAPLQYMANRLGYDLIQKSE